MSDEGLEPAAWIVELRREMPDGSIEHREDILDHRRFEDWDYDEVLRDEPLVRIRDVRALLDDAPTWAWNCPSGGKKFDGWTYNEETGKRHCPRCGRPKEKATDHLRLIPENHVRRRLDFAEGNQQ